MEEFQKPTVHIKNRDRVEHLVCEMIEGGREKLQVSRSDISQSSLTMAVFSPTVPHKGCTVHDR